jgi:hypothetical protein
MRAAAKAILVLVNISYLVFVLSIEFVVRVVDQRRQRFIPGFRYRQCGARVGFGFGVRRLRPTSLTSGRQRSRFLMIAIPNAATSRRRGHTAALLAVKRFHLRRPASRRHFPAVARGRNPHDDLDARACRRHDHPTPADAIERLFSQGFAFERFGKRRLPLRR